MKYFNLVVELKKVDGLQKCNLLIRESGEFKIMEKNVIIITWKSTHFVSLQIFKESTVPLPFRLFWVDCKNWVKEKLFPCISFLPYQPKRGNHSSFFSLLSHLLPGCKFISSISWRVKTSNGSYLIEKESPRM